jgi:hypothetical protein
MKRVHKLVIGLVVLAAVSFCAWSLLCPILFPQRVKAANDSYQQWLADRPTLKK